MACASCKPVDIEYSINPGEDVEIHTIKWTINGAYLFNQRALNTSGTRPAILADRVFILLMQIEKKYVGIENNSTSLHCKVDKPVTVLEWHGICNDKELFRKKSKFFLPPSEWKCCWTTETPKYIVDNLKDGDFILTVCIKIKKCKCPLFNNENVLRGNSMNDDFENLLSEELYSDVIIKSSEGKEYKAHKAILASRSAVLKAHFDHNTIECHTNVVESPLESEVLTEVLTFIYSDKAPRVDKIPMKLLAAADYYQLSRLKSLSEIVLIKKLAPENAFETLQTAELYSAHDLKFKTLEFIKKNAQAVIKSDGWKKVQSPELIKEIFECMSLHSG